VSEGRASRAAAPRLAVVVLTWNAREDTLACLTRLMPQLASGDLLVVADNGSDDGTAAAVRSRFPAVVLVENGGNLGFAGGVNAGLRRALANDADWCLVLNNDTEPAADLLAQLRSAAAEQPAAVGALQPLLVDAADHARIDSAGLAPRAFPGAHDLAQGAASDSLGTAPREIFGACGAAALLRREALQQVGVFDEGLFVLFEDVDLAFRLRAHGYETLLLPSVRLPHRRGISAARGKKATVAHARRTFWVQRNTVALALRYWPWPRLVVAAPVLVIRILHALWLARAHGPRTCAPLWRRALAERRVRRTQLRRAGADRWLGRDCG